MSSIVSAVRRAPHAVVAQKTTDSVRLLRGDAVKLEPVHWLWPGFIPSEMLTILGGSPGCGKTTLALSIAAIVTTGGRWPDGTLCRAPGDVLIWSGEDTPSVLAARLAASGADMTRVHFIDGVSSANGDEKGFDPARDMELLEARARQLTSPRLLIIDPIVSATSGDSHKNAEVRRSLQPIVAIGASLKAAVLGITHLTKGTAGRDPIERITGSLAFAAVARVVLVAAKTRPEPGSDVMPPRLFLRAKSNIGPDDGGFAYDLDRVEVADNVEGQRIIWREALDGTARDLLSDAEADTGDTGETNSATDDAGSYLRDLLTGVDSLPSRDVTRQMRAEGFTDKMIRSAREKLGVTVIRNGFGKDMASYWALPVVPKNTIRAHSRPQESVGIYGQEWQNRGMNGAAVDDEEAL